MSTTFSPEEAMAQWRATDEARKARKAARDAANAAKSPEQREAEARKRAAAADASAAKKAAKAKAAHAERGRRIDAVLRAPVALLTTLLEQVSRLEANSFDEQHARYLLRWAATYMLSLQEHLGTCGGGATAEDIAALRRRVQETHPDRGGKPEDFHAAMAALDAARGN